MKKMLLIIIISLNSIVSFAQDTFVKKYTSFSTKSNNVIGKLESTDITVVFNPKGIRDIVFYYTDGTVRRFHQITEVEKAQLQTMMDIN